MAAEAREPYRSYDFRDLRCPNLLIATITVIEKLPPGQLICITTRDLNAPSGLSAWTRQSGHTMVDMYQEGEDFVFWIRSEPQTLPAKAAG
ncbi:MAG: sulfurtransferase TusA family protein [Candidatus Promineifilaceae bacterium]